MDEKTRTILIDDERTNILTLKNLLVKHFPEIEIIATASNVSQGVAAINEHHPDLIFLDISMPDGDGFDLLSRVEFRSFEVIFTTAYDQYALKAFDYSAIHYLSYSMTYLTLFPDH